MKKKLLIFFSFCNESRSTTLKYIYKIKRNSHLHNVNNFFLIYRYNVLIEIRNRL